MCCVAFWFTKRADSFKGFVGNLKDMNPGSITHTVERKECPTPTSTKRQIRNVTTYNTLNYKHLCFVNERSWGEGGSPRVKLNINKYGDCIRVKRFWLLELSCTITKTFNEENPICTSYFLKNSNSHVRCILDYSFDFFLKTRVV
jgi:hypothetical protein